MRFHSLTLMVALLTLFSPGTSIGQTVIEKGADRTKLPPSELKSRADDLFPPTLAEAVKKQIEETTQRVLDADGDSGEPKSPATLFLADLFYARLRTGRFEGVPTVTWNGYDETYGRPTFYYAGDAFTYVTSSGATITPGAMDTDGGSVPKALHSFGNFNPWTFGPAFIIHDWIFVAHKCNVPPNNAINFEMSAAIMAEAMKTLMEVGFTNADGETRTLEKQEDTLYLMYQAVKSDFARELWNNPASTSCR